MPWPTSSRAAGRRRPRRGRAVVTASTPPRTSLRLRRSGHAGLMLSGVAVVAVLWIVGGRAGWAHGMVITPAEAVRPDLRRLERRLRPRHQGHGVGGLRGLMIGSVLAFVLALLAGTVPSLRRSITRFAAIANAAPWVAVAPCLLVILGRDRGPVAVAALAVFFFVFVSTVVGLGAAPRRRPRRGRPRSACAPARVVAAAARRAGRRSPTACASPRRPPSPAPSSASGTAPTAGSASCSHRDAERPRRSGCGRRRSSARRAGWPPSACSGGRPVAARGGTGRPSPSRRRAAAHGSAGGVLADRARRRSSGSPRARGRLVAVDRGEGHLPARRAPALGGVGRPHGLPGRYASAAARDAGDGGGGLRHRGRPGPARRRGWRRGPAPFAGMIVPVVVVLAATPLVAAVPAVRPGLRLPAEHRADPRCARWSSSRCSSTPARACRPPAPRRSTSSTPSAPRPARFRLVVLPAAVPHIVSGCRIAAGSSVIAAVVGREPDRPPGPRVEFSRAYRLLELPAPSAPPSSSSSSPSWCSPSPARSNTPSTAAGPDRLPTTPTATTAPAHIHPTRRSPRPRRAPPCRPADRSSPDPPG